MNAPHQSFRDFLRSDGVALFDGAMGTMLYQRGAFINRPFEELNVTEPGVVRDVHAAYLAAGADILETNTFAANRFRLSPHGLEHDVVAINQAGVRAAREAISEAPPGSERWVAGAMGPLGVRIEPFGPISRDEARTVFAEQAQALDEGGVDLFCLETFGHLPELIEAIQAVRTVSDKPIVAQIAMGSGGLTREGVKAADAARQMAAAGADVVGVNCSDALSTLAALGGMRAAVEAPLSCQPNAGTPRDVEGRKLYLGSPEYFVAWGRRAVRQGARLLGGCCGTTPEHIKALRSVLGEATPAVPHQRIARANDKQAAAPVARRDKSVIAAALADGRFVTAVEVPPVRGWDTIEVQRTARKLSLAGVTAMTIPEGPGSVAHLPPFAQADLCWRAGMATIIHYSARGRRLLRMQSDLLGAAATGVSDLLLITGDPMTPGAEQDAVPDLEVDSIGLLNLVARLNHGEDVGGNPIGRPTEFHIGVHLDPTAFDPERERSRFYWKADAGAEFAITAPVFDPQALRRCLEGLPQPEERGPIPVIATILPLTSASQAELFEHQASAVPAALIERMRAAEAAGAEEAEGLLIARELAAEVRPFVQGLQVVAPNGRVDLALSVLEVVLR